MTHYATITKRHAGLWTDFGEDFARRHFDAATLDALPRFVRGKNKGRIKAVIVWGKVERGGWVKNCLGGHVERRVGKAIDITLRKADWPNDYGSLIARARRPGENEEYDRAETAAWIP